MNRFRLFWHLFQFHTKILPWHLLPFIAFVTLVISAISGFSFGDHYLYRGSYREVGSIFMYFYLFLIAGQLAWGGFGWGKTVTPHQPWASGNYAFLFTRPIDRPTLYWAKLAVFSSLCVIPVLPVVAQSLVQPDIQIQLYGKSESTLRDYRNAYPDLTVFTLEKEPKDTVITLPGAGWDRLSLKATQTLILTLLILALGSLVRRWPRIWIPFFGILIFVILAPALALQFGGKSALGINWFSDETQLFWVRHHAASLWLALIVLTWVTVWDSRRTFLHIPRYKTLMG